MASRVPGATGTNENGKPTKKAPVETGA